MSKGILVGLSVFLFLLGVALGLLIAAFKHYTDVGRKLTKPPNENAPKSGKEWACLNCQNKLPNGTGGMRSGWRCQKCGGVLSPLQGFCPWCAPAPEITCEIDGL